MDHGTQRAPSDDAKAENINAVNKYGVSGLVLWATGQKLQRKEITQEDYKAVATGQATLDDIMAQHALNKALNDQTEGTDTMAENTTKNGNTKTTNGKTNGGQDKVDATAGAKKLADANGVALASVKGTGNGGRITVDDVKKAMDAPKGGGNTKTNGNGNTKTNGNGDTKKTSGKAPWTMVLMTKDGTKVAKTIIKDETVRRLSKGDDPMEPQARKVARENPGRVVKLINEKTGREYVYSVKAK